MPYPPFLYMFSHTLPTFKKMGLTEKEEEAIMLKNPQRILPIQ
jgi:predicted metal-dependent phosphotriesterase family hydrolase